MTLAVLRVLCVVVPLSAGNSLVKIGLHNGTLSRSRQRYTTSYGAMDIYLLQFRAACLRLVNLVNRRSLHGPTRSSS